MKDFKHKYSFYEWMEYIKHRQYVSELTNWLANK